MQLEVDYEVVNVKIYKGDNWTPQLRAPLSQPGINVRPGETLFTVNGGNVTAYRDIAAYFKSMADRSAVVTMDTDAATVRQPTVTPVATH